ncbi:MAG: YgiQ family radical SAM protein [Calditrichales bacterium]|nr:MAG: YgiQ family radical SAM protein [Calditrichales bacterium]
MFLPTTPEEMDKLGWKNLDVILVSGDSYIDSPYIGVAMIGKVLHDAGYRVGIIAQPDISSDSDIGRLGEPRLFWGVSGGSVDSMVANYTATGKKRKSDDFTPGGVNNRRPDRATIVYSNLIRRYFKDTRPIVLGGIEASLRRVAHYDYWSNAIRRSILFDAKADYLLYGMAERAVIELAARLKAGESPLHIRGLCYIAREKPVDCQELPSFIASAEDKEIFTSMFHQFYRSNDPVTGERLAQKQDTRYLVQNPPAPYLNGDEIDRLYALKFTRDLHPYYAQYGKVKALETIRFSITTHRGCYGECNFCAISVHQGKMIRSRSRQSILNEARELTAHPDFKGMIHDVGGPTANMYGIDCSRKATRGSCIKKRCLYPDICKELPLDHSVQTKLLADLRRLPGVKKVVVASGLRYDMILEDHTAGDKYMENLICHHISGQLKIAPEHTETVILDLMGKPNNDHLEQFRKRFNDLTQKHRLKQFLTYYLIAAHPGSREADMRKLRDFASQKLGIIPEQVQVFTPTPSTYSTLMYWTEKDPFTGKPVFVEKNLRQKEAQKAVFQSRMTKKPEVRSKGKKYSHR